MFLLTSNNPRWQKGIHVIMFRNVQSGFYYSIMKYGILYENQTRKRGHSQYQIRTGKNLEKRLTLEIATRQIRPGVRAQPVSKLLYCKCMIIYFKNLSV